MKKRKAFSVSYGILLLVFSAFVLLEGFVIPQKYAVVSDTNGTEVTGQEKSETGDKDTEAAEEENKNNSDSGRTHENGKRKNGKGRGRNGAASPGRSGESTPDTGSGTESSKGAGAEEETQGGSAEVTESAESYKADGVEITISTYRENGTDIYVADVVLDNAGSLKTAFADDIYGKNITEKTSVIAESKGAVLAINGDYYSARSGYVIRNGIIYSETSKNPDQEDLVIYKDGSMEVIKEGDITAAELIEKGAMNVFCFGPGLVENGSITVSEGEEVSKSKSSNPRTAIGWISDTHYVFVVSDGRTDASEGLSLYELGSFMEKLGCRTAYNLDGGGSSTMWFNGSVINNPTSGGSIRERSVSDIVYIG